MRCARRLYFTSPPTTTELPRHERSSLYRRLVRRHLAKGTDLPRPHHPWCQPTQKGACLSRLPRLATGVRNLPTPVNDCGRLIARFEAKSFCSY